MTGIGFSGIDFMWHLFLICKQALPNIKCCETSEHAGHMSVYARRY